MRLDPKFALSWALLSYVDARGYITQSLQPTVALCEEARQAAENALTLQPNLEDAVLAKRFYQYVSNQDAYTFQLPRCDPGRPSDYVLAPRRTAGPFAYDQSVNRRGATYFGSPSLGLPGAIADDSNSSVGFNGIKEIWVMKTFIVYNLDTRLPRCSWRSDQPRRNRQIHREDDRYSPVEVSVAKERREHHGSDQCFLHHSAEHSGR